MANIENVSEPGRTPILNSPRDAFMTLSECRPRHAARSVIHHEVATRADERCVELQVCGDLFKPMAAIDINNIEGLADNLSANVFILRVAFYQLNICVLQTEFFEDATYVIAVVRLS